MKIQLISLLGCLVVGLSSISAQKLRWCVISQNEMKKCQHLATKSPDLECVLKPSGTECIRSIKHREAHAITVEGEHIYQAGLYNYNLRPIIREDTKKKCCNAVAVVKKDTDFTINDLKGKTSCHSCYRTPGGWNIPMGRLIAQNKIPWDDPRNMSLEMAVSQLFSSSCVPGISKDQYPNLCQACQGDCSCSQNEKYSGDEGALQCLKNGHGQVAFVCQDAIPPSERQNYQLLCLDGSRRSVEEYENCFFAKEPHRAVVSRMDADSQRIYKVLKEIPDSDLFSSAGFGGKDLMFSDSTSELVQLSKSTDSAVYLGEDYYKAIHALTDGKRQVRGYPDITWCPTSSAELRKCLNILFLWCTNPSSVEDCTKKIMSGRADAMVVDSGHVYIAGKCGLVPVMVEQYDQKSCDHGGRADGRQARNAGMLHHFWGHMRRWVDSGYYAVAAVRKGSDVTWNTLQGKKSSHGGVKSYAGWIVPLSVICSNTPNCTLYNFFSKGCAPGADPQSNMCELCKGSGKEEGDESKCKHSHDEIYYGHVGAFRSLAENTSEVAFIKHTTILEHTNGKGLDWAKDLKSDDFELICPELPNESVKHTDFARCNLARVPGHAVITREDARADVVNFLKQAQANSDWLNLSFSNSTKCLQEITGSVEDFLTKKHIDMIERSYMIDQRVPDLVKACSATSCALT